jgi:hypothetical protein
MKSSMDRLQLEHITVIEQLRSELNKYEEAQQGHETTQLSVISTELEDFKQRMLEEEEIIRQRFEKKVRQIEQLER